VSLLKPLLISGREILPLIEGGKGIGGTDGKSSGAWAAAGGAGTFSAVYADFYDEKGNFVPVIYRGKNREERHEELVHNAILGGIAQAKIAHDISSGNGRIHLNILWGLSSVERILEGVLEKTSGLIHGITCGAGLPFRLAEIASKYKVYYYPIVSSAKAFSVLWKRAYSRVREWLGGVVYEDPWIAGGHNGLSNSEDPNAPESPYARVVMLRRAMVECGLHDVPVIIAGGVWSLRDWINWMDDPAIGPIAFQFGTRSLLTKESPIPDGWKKELLEIRQGDVSLNHFSPTGFYSSAIRNNFIKELEERNFRQVPYSLTQNEKMIIPIPVGQRQRIVYLTQDDSEKVKFWIESGFTEALRTPDSTLIFVDTDRFNRVRTDQNDCVGCLAYCRFSNWSLDSKMTEGKSPDPRSYCIRKTLDAIIHGDDVRSNLMFSGTVGYKFSEDPFYANGFVPTVKQLIERLQEELNSKD